ncbi:MAG: hypothetical protein G01um10143_657 [Parcubacteria group bacterium Gr01-1014_3]|nr:MAG: hypothetical protein G01um10143_657 [Parcubacteria group bacterium Gr01-1014_3]
MERPYIGIVGITSMFDAIWTAKMVQRVLCKTGYPLHAPQIGVQVTERSLRGEKNQNRRLPAIEEIWGIFDHAISYHKEIFTVIHFSAKNFAELKSSVDEIFEKMGGHDPQIVKGLQLNKVLTKITPDQMARIREKYPQLKIIIQMHKEFLTDFPINVMMHSVAKMEPYADHFLIDASGGTGTPLNPQLATFVAKNMLDFCSASKLGFAGGLNGKTVAKSLTEIKRRMGNKLDGVRFSIDAEGGLRDKLGEGYGNDKYNRKKAEAYFMNAVKTFQKLGSV